MKLFRTDVQPNRKTEFGLSLILFLVLVGGYVLGSYTLELENPKLMPTPAQIYQAFTRMAFEENRRGDIALQVDTVASATRFGISLVIIFFAVILGANMGVFPYLEAIFYRFMIFFDKIPAISLLPILFLVFGTGEMTKIALIVIGVFPTVALDAYLRAKAVPRQNIQKAKTLGSTEHEIAYRIVLPQIFPQVLDTIRLNFKAMMLLLIAGESIAAASGLGYRIFVVQRYLAMDVIISYVIWMTLLLFTADWLFQKWVKHGFPWAGR